ncbi:hypothetical protein NVP1171O_87 [Vibrio phage 1.171.O._10N.261.52.F12]|nr:hypothetical protein NVP1171O_87 [Vibrio phage 1.171.O._10N.261.52.F12]
MKTLILTALTAVALTSPVTHASESKTEQLQVLEDARNVALSGARKQDAMLASLICERRPEERNCEGTILLLLKQYKTNVIKIHDLDKAYHETRAKLLGR